MIYKIFFLFSGLFFLTFSTVFFEAQKFSILVKSIFYLVACSLGVISIINFLKVSK